MTHQIDANDLNKENFTALVKFVKTGQEGHKFNEK